jgi:hypothetical protein
MDTLGCFFIMSTFLSVLKSKDLLLQTYMADDSFHGMFSPLECHVPLCILQWFLIIPVADTSQPVIQHSL